MATTWIGQEVPNLSSISLDMLKFVTSNYY